MDSACVYEQKTVIHELTQGIQMAKHLRVNLNSAEARKFLIHNILSSYENALFLLKSGDSSGQPWAAALIPPNFTNSPSSTGSLHCGEHNFDLFEQPFIYQNAQNVVSNKTNSPFPLPPCSPKKLDTKPTNQYSYHNQLSPPNSYEMFSNTSSDHTGASVPSPFDFPSTPLGLMEDYQQTHFTNHFDDQVLQVYSPPFISPSISESNYLSEWGSSSSLEFSADADLDFNFDNSFF